MKDRHPAERLARLLETKPYREVRPGCLPGCPRRCLPGIRRRTNRKLVAARRRRARRYYSGRRNTRGCLTSPARLQSRSCRLRRGSGARSGIPTRRRADPSPCRCGFRQAAAPWRTPMAECGCRGRPLGRRPTCQAPSAIDCRAPWLAACSSRATSSVARLPELCRSKVRSRARAAIVESWLRLSSRAASASCASSASTISSPGSKKCSIPAQLSLSSGTPQAAASNNRPDGHHPISAIARRVTLSVRREDAKNGGCSVGRRRRRALSGLRLLTAAPARVVGHPFSLGRPPGRGGSDHTEAGELPDLGSDEREADHGPPPTAWSPPPRRLDDTDQRRE